MIQGIHNRGKHKKGQREKKKGGGGVILQTVQRFISNCFVIDFFLNFKTLPVSLVTLEL